jgi:Flp pilus assembly protein CpaB
MSRVLTLLVVVILSALATVLGSRFLRPPDPVQVAVVRVPVAARAISSGEQLGAANVLIRLCPRIDVPAGAMTVREVWEVHDRVVLLPFAKGEPITEDRLAPRGRTGWSPEDHVPRGYRAFTVTNPDILTDAPELVLPGNSVDVLIPDDDSTASDSTHTPSANTASHGTLTAEIVAIDMDLKGKEGARSITLQVKPDQAKQLEAAGRRGRLRMRYYWRLHDDSSRP